MKENITSNVSTVPREQNKLFFYNEYFELFVKLYKNYRLPNKILLSGESGLGKSTFAYHFINYVLSEREDFSYDYKNFEINKFNKTFRLINQNCHPNFFLIENFSDKLIIDVAQIRKMIDYANKTSFSNNIKFILVDNVEHLNIYSVNALLKIVEESPPKTYIIFIHNSSINMSDTLKSRFIEFKIFFSSYYKRKMTNKLFEYNNLSFEKNFIEKISSFYDSPGNILKLYTLIKDNKIILDNLNLKTLIFNLFEISLKNKNIEYLYLLQNCIELYYFKKAHKEINKKNIFLNYSNAIKQLSYLRKYNLDKNNTFFQIKENIAHE